MYFGETPSEVKNLITLWCLTKFESSLEQPSLKLILCTNYWQQRIGAGAYRLQIVWLRMLPASVQNSLYIKSHDIFVLYEYNISHFLTLY
jgi:hypothetical protein